MAKINVCGYCETKLGVIACSNSLGGSYCSIRCADMAELKATEKAPETYDDIIANLVRRVAELEKNREMQAKENRFVHDNIEGAKRDIVTWSQEIESMKYANDEIYSRLSHVEADVDERFMAELETAPAEGTEGDAVNHPQHYRTGRFETIEVIEDITAGYSDPFVAHCVGTSTKYLYRAPFKHESPTEDLRKAKRYIEFALAHIEKEGGA